MFFLLSFYRIVKVVFLPISYNKDVRNFYSSALVSNSTVIIYPTLGSILATVKESIIVVGPAHH